MPRWFIAPIGLVLMVTATTAAPRVKAKPAAPTFFPTAVGTTWVYREGTRQVTEIITAREDRDDGKMVTITSIAGWNSVYTRQLLVTRREVCLATFGPFTCTQPVCVFRAQAPAGEKWGTSDQDNEPLALGQVYRTGPNVEVDVPAGRFEATPVERQSTGFVSGGGCSMEWYSPGVGVVKAEYGRVTRVLVAFYPGR